MALNMFMRADLSRFGSQTLPSSFPLPQHRNSKKPTSLLSHLVFTHQTTLSNSDLELYDGDLPGAEQEVRRLQREGCRLFGVGGVGSELVEWEWGGSGPTKEVGRVKVSLSSPLGRTGELTSSSHSRPFLLFPLFSLSPLLVLPPRSPLAARTRPFASSTSSTMSSSSSPRLRSVDRARSAPCRLLGDLLWHQSLLPRARSEVRSQCSVERELS